MARDLPATVYTGGYRLDLEACTDPNDPERGTWVECWVTSPGGGHSNSLGLLADLGAFDDGPKISDSALASVLALAKVHGYEADPED